MSLRVLQFVNRETTPTRTALLQPIVRVSFFSGGKDFALIVGVRSLSCVLSDTVDISGDSVWT